MAFREIIPEGEAAEHEAYGAEIRAFQARLQAKAGGRPLRALHNKQHLGAVGTLEVKARAGGRAGIFAEDRSYPLYVRFSNGSERTRSDRVHDARGFSVKLVGVAGPKLIPGLEGELTQDFLFVQNPALAFRNPAEFMGLLRAAQDGPARLLARMIAGYGLRRSLQIIVGFASGPRVKSYATQDFHTAAPIAFGASAAKLALFPLQHSPAPSSRGSDRLRRDLAARLKAAPLSWSLRAQLFADDESTPIEDASVVWSGPWIELGTLTLPRQDPDSDRGREISDLVSRLSFDPWHAVEGHRPLGSMMRARAASYRESTLGRNAAPEPRSVIALD
jgi:hypothetical protein